MSDSLWPSGLQLTSSSIHGVSQARILEWVALPSSRLSAIPQYKIKLFFEKGRSSCSQGRWLLKSTWVLYLASKCWYAVVFHRLHILWLHPLRLSCLYCDNAVRVSVPSTLLSDLSSTQLKAVVMLAKHILALANFLIKTLQCFLVPFRLKQILFNFGDPLSMMF